VINRGNPFDDFDDFVSAPLILPATVEPVKTKPLHVIPKQVEVKFESLTSSLDHLSIQQNNCSIERLGLIGDAFDEILNTQSMK